MENIKREMPDVPLGAPRFSEENTVPVTSTDLVAAGIRTRTDCEPIFEREKVWYKRKYLGELPDPSPNAGPHWAKKRKSRMRREAKLAEEAEQRQNPQSQPKTKKGRPSSLITINGVTKRFSDTSNEEIEYHMRRTATWGWALSSKPPNCSQPATPRIASCVPKPEKGSTPTAEPDTSISPLRPVEAPVAIAEAARPTSPPKTVRVPTVIAETATTGHHVQEPYVQQPQAPQYQARHNHVHPRQAPEPHAKEPNTREPQEKWQSSLAEAIDGFLGSLPIPKPQMGKAVTQAHHETAISFDSEELPVYARKPYRALHQLIQQDIERSIQKHVKHYQQEVLKNLLAHDDAEAKLREEQKINEDIWTNLLKE